MNITLSQMCDILQYWAHEGHARDKVLIKDTDGNVLCEPENVTLYKEKGKEEIIIEVKHKE